MTNIVALLDFQNLSGYRLSVPYRINSTVLIALMSFSLLDVLYKEKITYLNMSLKEAETKNMMREHDKLLHVFKSPITGTLIYRKTSLEFKAINDFIREHADLLYQFSKAVEQAYYGPVVRKFEFLCTVEPDNICDELDLNFTLESLNALETFFLELELRVNNIGVSSDGSLHTKESLKNAISLSQELLTLIPRSNSSLKSATKF